MIPRVVRQFSYPLNIGTDICHIPRIYRILNSARAARFVQRVLTKEEIARKGTWSLLQIPRDDAGLQPHRDASGEAGKVNSDSQADNPLAKADRDSELWKAAVFMAGRFAVKEAAIKAHPHRRLTFQDITIAPRELANAQETERPWLGSGPPIAIIKAAADTEGQDQEAMISISHDGDYATAVCMGFV